MGTEKKKEYKSQEYGCFPFDKFDKIVLQFIFSLTWDPEYKKPECNFFVLQ